MEKKLRIQNECYKEIQVQFCLYATKWSKRLGHMHMCIADDGYWIIRTRFHASFGHCGIYTCYDIATTIQTTLSGFE